MKKSFVKKYWLLIVVLALLVLATALILPDFIALKQMDARAREWEGYINDRTAYVLYKTVYWGSEGSSLDLQERLTNFGITHFYEVYAVIDGRIYFSSGGEAEEGFAFAWQIASVSVSGDDLRVHATLQLSQVIGYTPYYYASAPYEEKNGYYYDGKIVLSDHNKVLVYTIATQTVETFECAEYIYPEQTSVLWEDNSTLNFTWMSNGTENAVSMQKLAEEQEVFAEIYALRQEDTVDGDSCLSLFFSKDRITILDGTPYIVGRILNRYGGSYAVLIKYDLSAGQAQYQGAYYTEGSPEVYFYPVYSA